MTLNRDLKNVLGIAKKLVGSGEPALAGGDPRRSASLFAAAEASHQVIGAIIPPFERTRFEREAALVRAQLGEETFAVAWHEG